MYITSVKADGYKNLDSVDIRTDERLNIFCGKNAQGKTNLIEAIWLCTGCRSFRAAKDRNFIGFLKEKADVSVSFKNNEREQNISFGIMRGRIKDKNITLNGVSVPLLSRLFGSLKCVVFTPDDLSLLKGSPDTRRSFCDLSASQLKPSFVSALSKYNNLLSQRNAVIKNINLGISKSDELEVWDRQIAETGAYISVIRNIYCKSLNEYAERLYSEITDSKEKIKIYYSSTIFSELGNNIDYESELFNIYYSKLLQNRADDIRVGYTLHGVHRDDIITEINGLDARDFGSQGQQRSIAVVMKIAQAELIGKETGETPVMLLDDVLSELDDSRKRFILKSLDNIQVFITCCDESFIKKEGAEGKIFRVEEGKIYD